MPILSGYTILLGGILSADFVWIHHFIGGILSADFVWIHHFIGGILSADFA